METKNESKMKSRTAYYSKWQKVVPCKNIDEVAFVTHKALLKDGATEACVTIGPELEAMFIVTYGSTELLDEVEHDKE